MQLSLFFDVVYVPRQVHVELNRKHKFRHRLNKLYETSVYRRCLVGDHTNVRLLMMSLDEGEAEGLIQAQEKSIDRIILDERKARAFARNMGITPIGVARLLFRLERESYISDARKLVAKLEKDLKFRISERVLQDAFQRAHEPL